MSAIRALALMGVMLKANLPYHSALASSRGIAKGAHRRLVDRVFRGTLLGTYSSLGRAIEAEAEELPRELAWVGRTLKEYMICGSEPEQSRKEEMLDRAFSTALDSCRQSMKESVSGLKVPVSTIFALGIVLPIVLATMLPLWGAAYADGFTQEFSSAGADGPTSAAFPDYALAAPILLFPALCLIASAHVLSKGEFAPYRGGSRQILLLLAFFGIMGASAFAVLFAARLDIDTPIFAAAAVPASMLAGKALDIGKEVEEDSMYDHPSELNSIPSRLMSGEHFVRAVAMASEDRSEKRAIFWRAIGTASSQEAEHGFDEGMLGLISETAKSDSCLAAQMLRQVARHLNDLGLVRMEMRFDLRPIAQSVLVATVFLSPFVLGIAAGFDSIGMTTASPVGNLFVVFVAEMVIAGLWLVRRMGVGEGPLGKMAGRPYVALAASGLVFLLSQWFSQAMFS